MGDSPRGGSFRNNGSEASGSGKKVRTLDPLGEEDGSSDSESDDELAAAQAAAQAEANKFEMLCDGVLGSIALVQAALAEFLNLKDELLQHALPPSLLARLTMISGRLFRSTTDLYTPTSELVRLVRVYSGSWEEKSQALKKLHADYESKHKQLNIAIRRLQLADAQAKRIAHEKRIMNWEKLFAKLTSSRGHGRRWRFLIDNFKQKSKLGMEHLHAYIDEMDRQEDSDSEDEEEEKKKEDSISHTSANEFDMSSSDELEFTEGDSDEEDEEASTARATAQTGQTQQDIDSDMMTPASKKVKFRRRSKQSMPEDGEKGGKHDMVPPETIPEPQVVYVEVPPPKPPSADKTVWTHEPQYDYTLNVRLYKPQGLDHKDMKCSVNFQKKFQKSNVLGDIKDAAGRNGKSPLKSALKPKSMIGSKVSSAASRKDSTGTGPNSNKSSSGKKNGAPTPAGGFQDLAFAIGDQPLRHEGALQDSEGAERSAERSETETVTTETSGPSRPVSSTEEPMRIAVHAGTLEDMVAMGTVGMEDLHSMEIEIVEDEDKLKALRPSSFPLYPVTTSLKDRGSVPTPCGNIPMAFYYTRVHRPFVHDKETEAETVTDIVLDLTGVDLRMMRKEDLSVNKSYEERCLSALSIPSSISSEKPEMVPRAEVDILVEQHNQELTLIQDEYEQRLNELAKSLEQLQNEQLSSLLNPQRSSDGLRRATSPLRGWATDSRMTKSAKELGPIKGRGKRRSNLPNWGSDLPKDFFERLKLFSEESDIRRRQLIERTKSDMEGRIVKQLASQYKLDLPTDGNVDANKEVSLPAVFMPTKIGQLYNPRAHSYFHPTGSLGQLRLTQPPSMFQLPPLPNKTKLSVINLFDIRKNFEERTAGGGGGGGDWMGTSARSSPTRLSQPNTPLPSNLGETPNGYGGDLTRPITE